MDFMGESLRASCLMRGCSGPYLPCSRALVVGRAEHNCKEQSSRASYPRGTKVWAAVDKAGKGQLRRAALGAVLELLGEAAGERFGERTLDVLLEAARVPADGAVPYAVFRDVFQEVQRLQHGSVASVGLLDEAPAQLVCE